VHVPLFCRRQILAKGVPGCRTARSGTVTSAMNSALSHRAGTSVPA
jgi:hypothetical protein